MGRGWLSNNLANASPFAEGVAAAAASIVCISSRRSSEVMAGSFGLEVEVPVDPEPVGEPRGGAAPRALGKGHLDLPALGQLCERRPHRVAVAADEGDRDVVAAGRRIVRMAVRADDQETVTAEPCVLN